MKEKVLIVACKNHIFNPKKEDIEQIKKALSKNKECLIDDVTLPFGFSDHISFENSVFAMRFSDFLTYSERLLCIDLFGTFANHNHKVFINYCPDYSPLKTVRNYEKIIESLRKNLKNIGVYSAVEEKSGLLQNELKINVRPIKSSEVYKLL